MTREDRNQQQKMASLAGLAMRLMRCADKVHNAQEQKIRRSSEKAFQSACEKYDKARAEYENICGEVELAMVEYGASKIRKPASDAGPEGLVRLMNPWKEGA
jgi:hypothetical protein